MTEERSIGGCITKLRQAARATITMSEAPAHDITASEIEDSCLRVLFLRELAYRVTAKINETQRAIEARIDTETAEPAPAHPFQGGSDGTKLTGRALPSN